MFDRPKFDKYLYTTVHRLYDEEQPRVHEDVELKAGEKVGLVIGNRRIVVSVDDCGKVRTKLQKRVSVWADIED